MSERERKREAHPSYHRHPKSLGFPGGSAGKESTCNEGDLGLIPGLGRCPGGGHGKIHVSTGEESREAVEQLAWGLAFPEGTRAGP